MSRLHQRETKDNLTLTDDATLHLEAARSALRRAVDCQVGTRAAFDVRERALLELSNEVGRRILEQDLQELAEQYNQPSLRVNEQVHDRHSQGTVNYSSQCGVLRVQRWIYRARRKRNDQTLVPMELAAGMVERATPALAYRLALGYAQCPGRHVQQQLRSSFRYAPSRSTQERIALSIGERARAQTPVIEPLVRQVERLPCGATGISLGLDRTTVPMEERLPEGARRAEGRRKRVKPYLRRAPAPFEVNYRMAYVGTVSFVDASGESLKTLRYASSADQGPGHVVASMMADVQQAHVQRCAEHRRRLPIAIVQDGAPEMWNLVTDAVTAAGFAKPRYEAIDWHHLVQRLCATLALLPLQKVDRERISRRWRMQLLNDDQAIDRIEKYIARALRGYADACAKTKRRVSLEDFRQLRSHLVYIRNNKSRMRYQTLRDAGMPVGSGATEGACKSTISVRAKGCGQRWKPPGINAVLTLRAHYMSKRLPAFWSIFSDAYKARVTAA